MKERLLVVACFISMISIAQNFNVDMSVSKTDLEKNFYEKDSTANALVIYDYGNSFVDNKSFWLRVQNKQKVKILRTEGIEKGEVEVRLYKGKNSKEKIQDIQGTTYNLENGEIVRTQLDATAIFKEENENYTLVKFVLPNVKVGSVITYSYETQSRFMAKYQPWYFQGPNPVLYSEYNTSIPGNYEYHIKLVGSLPLVTNESHIEKECIILNRNTGASCSVSKYVMKDIPAYRQEGFTTTPLNYTARIEYELSVVNSFDGSVDKITQTWESVDSDLEFDANFGKQINKKSLVKKVLPTEIQSIADDLEKAKAIYQYVLNNYTWNKKSERYDVSVKNLLKEKAGSAFEINFLLENLLNLEGFEVFPILISTRANGLPTKLYPILSDFNYVILKTTINNKSYFLDATDPYLSFGELPFRCLNQYGRLMDFKNGSDWVNIEVTKFSSQQHSVSLSALEDASFSGTIQSRFRGYHAHDVKQMYDENPQRYKERESDEYSDILIEDHEVLKFDKTQIGFGEKITFELEPEFIGNKIYLNPFLIKFFEENPFKLEQRTYPIDFGYKDSYSYALKINLDDKFKILEIPEAVNYALPYKSGSFIFKSTSQNNEVTLYFKITFNKAIYAPDYYDALKIFMSKVVETQKNALIVLEKN